MSILSRVFKVVLKATVKALLQDAVKADARKAKIDKKVTNTDKKFVAERKRLKAKAEKYKERVISTHDEQAQAKRKLNEQRNALVAKASESKAQASKLEAILG